MRTVADPAWQIKGVGDFDGDGKTDILWRNSASGENYLYLMNGISIANEGYVRTVPIRTGRSRRWATTTATARPTAVAQPRPARTISIPMDGTAIKPSEGYLRSCPPARGPSSAADGYDAQGGNLKRLLALLAFGFAALTQAFAAPPAVTLRPVVSGLSAPVAVANAGDGSGRLFIAEQDGRVRIVTKEGALLATPFLNISPLDGGERGLLGLAFHPQYAANRKFYVFYTPNASAANYTLRVSEFLASAANPDVADAASERLIIDDPAPDPRQPQRRPARLRAGRLPVHLHRRRRQRRRSRRATRQNLNVLLGKVLRHRRQRRRFSRRCGAQLRHPAEQPVRRRGGRGRDLGLRAAQSRGGSASTA